MMIVRESIAHFKRGQDPAKSLSIGFEGLLKYPFKGPFPDGIYLLYSNSVIPGDRDDELLIKIENNKIYQLSWWKMPDEEKFQLTNCPWIRENILKCLGYGIVTGMKYLGDKIPQKIRYYYQYDENDENNEFKEN